MMNVLGLGFLLVASLCLAVQVYWGWRFALGFHSSKITVAENEWPSAAVILCLRGADSSLAACLRSLLKQDYPNYDVHVVLDSVDDPADEVLRRLAAENPPKWAHISVLTDPLPTCSLKVSALMQAIVRLERSVQVVALIDADVVPYRNWLRDLVGPLFDPAVGATSGFRWYVAKEPTNLWTRIRALWNAGACSQMAALNIPWGGSLALRSSVFRNPALFSMWSRSFGEDTSCHQILRTMGLRLDYVPAVTMVNPEPTTAKKSFGFIRRQLVSARLGHEKWPVVLITGLATTLALLGLVAVAGLALAKESWTLGLGLTAISAVYVIGLGTSLAWANRSINRIVRARGESTHSLALATLLALPITLFVYLVCLVSAALARRIEWRGITYSLESGGRIRMQDYHPYRDVTRISALPTKTFAQPHPLHNIRK